MNSQTNIEQPPQTSIKETLTSVIIAFALAFVFRGFVIEAFVIPTGSMAPTLMGAHMRFRDPANGYAWQVNPWDYTNASLQVPKAVQGQPPDRPISVTNPMTKEQLKLSSVEKLAGDRIFVLKYLYSIFDPQRWDVVVFKNPRDPAENYIKRLVGLPNEQIALIDGDLFTRPIAPETATDPTDKNTWAASGWTIQRKPEMVQRSVWQPVYNSDFPPKGDGFRSPWLPKGTGWQTDVRKPMSFAGAGTAELEWDSGRWPITDRYAYNETPAFRPLRTDNAATGGLPTSLAQEIYPVGDVRVALAMTPTEKPVTTGFTMRARRHEFRAQLSPESGKAVVSVRPEGDAAAAWKEIGQGDLPSGALAAGRATNVEFWFVDQSVQVFVEGSRVVNAPFDWTPSQRVEASFGAPLDQMLARESGESIFSDPRVYGRAEFGLSFAGGGFTLHRVQVDRDLFYQPTQRRGMAAAAGSHPYVPKFLGPDHFFTCGDNSPASDDCRSWYTIDPWVARQIDPTIGVVPRDLLIGKAFFVYFPSAKNRFGLPVPDFGRMRFIF